MLMRDGQIGRFVLLPFSIGCDSESSVGTNTATATAVVTNKNKGSKSLAGKKSVEAKQTPELPNASVSQRLHRFINRLFKSFSNLFVYKEDEEKIETEMEIGFPTDVKHVTHIGLDGSSRINNTAVVNSTCELDVTFPSISLEQFELAMAAQSTRPLPQKV